MEYRALTEGEVKQIGDEYRVHGTDENAWRLVYYTLGESISASVLERETYRRPINPELETIRTLWRERPAGTREYIGRGSSEREKWLKDFETALGLENK